MYEDERELEHEINEIKADLYKDEREHRALIREPLQANEHKNMDENTRKQINNLIIKMNECVLKNFVQLLELELSVENALLTLNPKGDIKQFWSTIQK